MVVEVAGFGPDEAMLGEGQRLGHRGKPLRLYFVGSQLQVPLLGADDRGKGLLGFLGLANPDLCCLLGLLQIHLHYPMAGVPAQVDNTRSLSAPRTRPVRVDRRESTLDGIPVTGSTARERSVSISEVLDNLFVCEAVATGEEDFQVFDFLTFPARGSGF
jgi:hypothetical protein